MKKKSRRSRSSETAQQQQQSGRMQTSMNMGEGKRPSGNRGKTQRRLPGSVGMSKIYQEDSGMEANYGVTHTDKATESKSKSTTGRLSTAICRLCHGKFSPRSLRHAFNKWPQDSEDLFEESDAAAQSPLLFHTDFQRLVGVQLDRDPSLSEFVCKKCYTKFYKCHSILIRFLQRVNLPPLGKENSKNRKNAKSPESTLNIKSTASPSFSSDSKCLHSLISWAHQHGEACRSCPDLKEVLEGQCWGSVKVVWGCVDGHSYIMDTQCGGGGGGVNPSYTLKVSGEAARGGNGKGVPSEDGDNDDQEQEAFGGNQRTPARSAAHLAQSSPPTVTPQTQSSTLIDWASNTEDFIGPAEAISPVPAQLEDRTADTDLSDRAVSEDEFEESGKGALSEDELFEPHSEKRTRRVNAPSKRRPNQKAPEEPKVKRKPGPKPGWKNKFKPKGEELPNIYKCPYQGCTAVYRAPDGLKKHIKEHHEEVRERPCPHPGCNKVFMIDRYLQRHVKLIHTEERNYICDQCGQTFKQRKHLSVHQMRHSGAKPLQCEICGFQCRQRASLKYHMTKHKAEADLEFACLICGKRFEKAHNLNVHMSMVHPLTQVEAYKDSSQQQPPQPQYSNLHTITLTGEVVQQEQDR